MLRTLTPEEILAFFHRRKSMRQFSSRTVDPKIIREVLAVADSVPAFVQDSLRLSAVINSELSGKCGVAYLAFVSAPLHIIVVARQTYGFLENAGFLGQAVVLKATEYQLGTCWVAGFLDEKKLAELARCSHDERVVAVIPLGYPAVDFKGHAVNYVFSTISNSPSGKRRHSLEKIVFYGDYGHSAAAFLHNHPQLTLLFEAARLSPSWRNRQPWRFIAKEHTVYLLALQEEEGKKLSGYRDGLEYFRVDLGIAMCQFYFMAQACGLPGKWILTDEWKTQFQLPATAVAVAKFELT